MCRLLPGTGFRERVACARSAGYAAITLFPEHYLDAQRREGLSPADMRQLLLDHDLKVATVDPLLDWFGGEPSRAEQLLYEMADALGAPALNAAPAFAPDLPADALAKHFAALCERAAKRGLRVDLEVLPWSRIGNYRQAFEVLRLSGARNAGITLDCLHFHRGGDSVESLGRVAPELLRRISNIQLCDTSSTIQQLSLRDRIAAGLAMLATARNGLRVMGAGAMIKANRKAYTGREDAAALMQEATCRRLPPGSGDLPLAELLHFITQAGIEPEYGLEVFSIALNRLPALEAARHCMEHWQALYRSLETAAP